MALDQTMWWTLPSKPFLLNCSLVLHIGNTRAINCNIICPRFYNSIEKVVVHGLKRLYIGNINLVI